MIGGFLAMFDLDNAADGQLGHKAVEAVRFYLEQLGHGKCANNNDDFPVTRTQISGLLQIARNEPGKIAYFAEKQRAKVEARLQSRNRPDQLLVAQRDFWNLVYQVCTGRITFPNFNWSLPAERDKAMPGELLGTEQHTGKTAPEQAGAKKRVQEERQRWQHQWDQQHYPIFFQRFCSHYVYEMAKRVASKGPNGLEEER
jgi:hypothetical protein